VPRRRWSDIPGTTLAHRGVLEAAHSPSVLADLDASAVYHTSAPFVSGGDTTIKLGTIENKHKEAEKNEGQIRLARDENCAQRGVARFIQWEVQSRDARFCSSAYPGLMVPSRWYIAYLSSFSWEFYWHLFFLHCANVMHSVRFENIRNSLSSRRCLSTLSTRRRSGRERRIDLPEIRFPAFCGKKIPLPNSVSGRCLRTFGSVMLHGRYNELRSN